MNRRRVLRATGGAIGAGIAGCLGGPRGDDGGGGGGGSGSGVTVNDPDGLFARTNPAITCPE